MNFSNYELLLISVAITAIMMLGSTNIRTNLMLYGWHTLFIAISTAWMGAIRNEAELSIVALVIAVVKAFFVPMYLSSIIRKVGMANDSGAFLPTAVSMHVGIALLGASYLLAQRIPSTLEEASTGIGATVALSLIATGMMLMLTRRIAVNQIVGFLVIENGIYLFSLTQTRGMPMAIEMGVLLDLLVAVMISGLLLFRIKKNFEHIDVTKLNELKD